MNDSHYTPPPTDILALARTIATQHSLDPALVCAVAEQESAWDAHSIRYEPAFRTRYVAPLGLSPTEEIARSISWGLMQVMGQVAREHGFTGRYLSALADPAAGLDIGCVVLASKIAAASRELAAAPQPPAVISSPPASQPKQQGTAPSGLAAASPVSSTFSASSTPSAAAPLHRALLLWNGGANPDYPAQVLARLSNYR
jgi:transglycosylase-like protein with SLT domain